MNLLIIAATENEIQPFLKTFQINIGTEEKYQFRVANLTVDMLITGVGITATSFTLGQHLKATYDLVINVGIAGSFNKALKKGEVVHVISEQFGDFGAEDDTQFISVFELGLLSKNQFPFSEGKLLNENAIDMMSIANLKGVTGITVNKVTGSSESILKIEEKFHPEIETMEGAAFFYASKMIGVPFIQIRAISNYVEKRNRAAWNIPLAVENLNDKLVEIVNELANNTA